jgi:hypothetical protein
MIHSSMNLRNSAQANSQKRVSVPRTDLAWIDSGAWRLPSGQALSEFALQAGFLVPHLFAADGRSSSIGSLALARESGKRAG